MFSEKDQIAKELNEICRELIGNPGFVVETWTYIKKSDLAKIRTVLRSARTDRRDMLRLMEERYRDETQADPIRPPEAKDGVVSSRKRDIDGVREAQ